MFGRADERVKRFEVFSSTAAVGVERSMRRTIKIKTTIIPYGIFVIKKKNGALCINKIVKCKKKNKVRCKYIKKHLEE